MFENQGKLLTWSTSWRPSCESVGVANRLKDHRVEYLDYEGEISGGRGTVQRVYEGTFELGTLEEKRFTAELYGELQCSLQIVASSGGCESRVPWELKTFGAKATG